MAEFFTNIFDKITGLFKSKDLENNITNFQTKIDTIITDLILPYAQPTKLSANDRFRDLITLLDSKKCNKIAITLSSNLDKNYTKLQLEQFASSILVGKENAECKDDSCADNAEKTINNNKTKVSKKEICNAVAVHYVKILNVIAAVLTAVNPSDNICLNRLRNLLTVIGDDEKTGVSAVCDIKNNVVKGSIMHESGFKQLLMLYYYHLMQDTETESEKANVRSQYEYMVKIFSGLVMFVDPNLKNIKESNMSYNRENSYNNKMEKEANEDEEEAEIKNEIENINSNESEEELPVKPDSASANNIKSLRNNINSKLTNIKDD